MTLFHSVADASLDPEENIGVMLAGCCVAIGSLVPVAMYQMRAIKHLPDPPSEIFNSDAITSSREAHPFGIPDALLGIASFGMTLSLVFASRRSLAARRLLAAKLALDTTAAVFNAARQVVSFRKLCSWCTVTALATGVTAYGGRAVMQKSFEEGAAFLKSEG